MFPAFINLVTFSNIVPKTNVFGTGKTTKASAWNQALAAAAEAGFLAQPRNARRAELVAKPVSREISRQVRPCARREAILEASAPTLGLPSLVPLALAFFKPERTRSTIKLRSNSAM